MSSECLNFISNKELQSQQTICHRNIESFRKENCSEEKMRKLKSFGKQFKKCTNTALWEACKFHPSTYLKI